MYLNQLDKDELGLMLSIIKILSLSENMKNINFFNDMRLISYINEKLEEEDDEYDDDDDDEYDDDDDDEYDDDDDDENPNFASLKQKIIRLKRVERDELSTHLYLGYFSLSLSEKQLFLLSKLIDTNFESYDTYDFFIRKFDSIYGLMESFIESYEESIETTIEEYKNKSSIKKQMQQKIIENDYDLFSLDESSKSQIMFDIDLVKESTISLLIDKLMSNKEILINHTIKEKSKTLILFNILCIFPNKLNELSMKLINNLCKNMKFETDYIDELKQLAFKYSSIIEELDEIIHE